MNLCSRCSGELPRFAVFCPHCSQTHEPNFDDLIDLTIDGRYRVYRRLGQGGLSTIFAATDLETDSVVAIKFSNPAQLVIRSMNYALDAARARDYWDETLERMRREAETLATINHPNIVRFNGTGMINDDLRYVVMEFLSGRALRDEIDREGAFESSKAVSVALEVASALIEVHARGIVHRDINPRNIMIVDRGEATIKLIDFGIAKFPQPPGAPPFTQHSTLAGTVAYASPEQCASRPVDHRSDIYSLGVALYEMVTGQRPFTGRTPTEVALMQIQSEPKPPRSINPAIPGALERTILRAMAKNPAERQQSAEELAEELRKSSNRIFIPLGVASPEAEDQSNETSFDPSEAEETAEMNLRLARKRRRRFAAAAAAMIIVIAAAAIFGLSSKSSRRAAPDVSANVVATPSPEASPAIGSDADALELAANAPAPDNNVAAPDSQAASRGAAQNRAANPTAPNNNAAPAAATTATAPIPALIPPKAQPQMPPAPSPEIALKRARRPESEPDLSQGPLKEGDGASRRRENDDAIDLSNWDHGDDAVRDSDRDGYASIRRRDNDAFYRRRPPEAPNGGGAQRDDDADNSAGMGPKVYHWSGRVDDEREITIELPGAPGTVEIPRAYRNRVGVIEPPSANNGWRFVVLRIFGRGGVSIIIRWWPAGRNAVKLTAWK